MTLPPAPTNQYGDVALNVEGLDLDLRQIRRAAPLPTGRLRIEGAREDQESNRTPSSEVAIEQRGADAETLAVVGRMIAGDLGAIFGIQRFGSAARYLVGQAVVIGEFVQIGIGSGQMMRNGALGLRQFRGVFAAEDADVLAGIEIPVVAANQRLGEEHGIFNDGGDGEIVAVAGPMLREDGFDRCAGRRCGGCNFPSDAWW